MKIAVLVKQVPDTETKTKISGDGKSIERAEIKYILNPYDEFAVEQALKTKEAAGGEVIVLSLGPDRAIEAIRTALAMGADRAIHVKADEDSLDSYAAALAIANALKAETPDLIFCGKQAIDGDCAQVGPMVAEFLNIPQVTVVDHFELGADKQSATLHRAAGGGSTEIYAVHFPVLVSCDKGLNTPRYASLPGIMKAKTKPVAAKSATELLGGEGTLIELSSYEAPPPRPAGRILSGELSDQAKEVVRLLREEAKVI